MHIVIVRMTPCITTFDSRVFREACSLKEAGHDVLILGFLRHDTKSILLEEEYSGLRIHRLKVPIKNDLVALLVFLKRAYKLARNFKGDVIHAHDLPVMLLACFCKRNLGCRIVYDNHELWTDRNTSIKPRWLWHIVDRVVENFVIRKADAVLVVSKSIGKVMEQRYHMPITVLFNYPIPKNNTLSLSLREHLGISKSKRVILYSGLIMPNKGVEEAIRVLKCLPEYDLVLMGCSIDNAYLAEVHFLISQEGMVGRVHFMPAVSFDLVTSWASSADVGIILQTAKYKSYELAFTNKFLESVASGLPVVVNSQCTEMLEFVKEHDIGVGVDIKNIADVARGIRMVAEYSRYRLNSQNLSKLINWHEEAKKLLRLYDGF